jgi:hypothetical protein
MKLQKESYYAKKKRIQSIVHKLGIGVGLTKRITYRYPISLLEKLIEENERRKPKDPANYFLNGLKRSRIKHRSNRKFNRKRKLIKK